MQSFSFSKFLAFYILYMLAGAEISLHAYPAAVSLQFSLGPTSLSRPGFLIVFICQVCITLISWMACTMIKSTTIVGISDEMLYNRSGEGLSS